MLLNCGVEEDSWESFGQQWDQTSPSWSKSVLNIRWKDWCWSLTLWVLMDYSSLGSSAHGILQVRILEWIAIPFSKGSSQSMDWIWVSCIAGRFFTFWTTRKAQLLLLLLLHAACMQSCFIHVWLCGVRSLWTEAHQAPPSTGFSRQEYLNGLPFPSPREAQRPD